jgi:D-glycero-beta-D-manno-heptose-7-phosphate kinase
MTKIAKQTDRLRQVLEAFAEVTVTVLGDLVADEFVFGEISRVSREAPVLILKHRETTVVPGGGGNAVMNLADLGVTVLPVGVVGDDEPGRLLLECLKEKKISTSGIVKLKNHATTTKTRILAGMPHAARQQVVRIDREPGPLNEIHPALLDLIASARNFAKASDALLVSDYGYGAATPRLLTFIRSDGSLGEMPVTLDSRYRLLEYTGVTAATPNEPEVEAALNVKIGTEGDVMAAGEKLREEMKLQSLVITRGSDGMVVFQEGGDPVEVPIHGSDQVTDVTGAGDTFTAALATGADPLTAAKLANYAGGIVVMKRGTATVTREELLLAIESETTVKTR